MNPLTNAGAQAAINTFLADGLTNIYLGLFTVLPAKDGTGGTEVSGGSYARVQVVGNDWTKTNGVATNDNDIQFAKATASWGDVVGVGIFTASSGGTLYWRDYISQSANVHMAVGNATGDTFTSYGHTFANGDRVIFQRKSGLTGITADTTLYYVVNVSGDTFQVSTSSGGAAVNYTTNGYAFVSKVDVDTVGINVRYSFPAGQLTVKFE